MLSFSVRAAAAALVLLAPAFAGCLSSDLVASNAALGIDATQVPVPDGATLETIEDGVALVWATLALPFNVSFVVPEGTTTVTATANVPAGGSHRFEIVDPATGRRLCESREFSNWRDTWAGKSDCSALAATHALPATWAIQGWGQADISADAVRVELSSAPVQGPAALLDLTQISKPTFNVLPTEALTLDADDGTPLYVEVTRPDGPGPFPVIISSSPYNAPDHASGLPSMWSYWTNDHVQRGYVAVNADVRGTAKSGGCSDVWGSLEQADQVMLVNWAAAQPWSDGNVGFYGQSYPGTTPVEAAVHAPDALKAIVTVAPVASAYQDWHFGGVPNGEWASAVGYQSAGAQEHVDPTDPAALALLGAGPCDPTIAAQPTDPRGLYTDFFVERNLTAHAGAIKAAVLYTQGFHDPNVKANQIPLWFNDLDSPKLGLFGHWGHQHAKRVDRETLFLAWFDQYLKGKDVGLEKLEKAYVTDQLGGERAVAAWPDDSAPTRLFADFASGTLHATSSDATGTVVLAPDASATVPGGQLTLTFDVVEPFVLTGEPTLPLRASLATGGNAHVAAFLYDDGPDGSRFITFGMFNLAHHGGHDTWAPLVPQEVVAVDLPLNPTEWAFEAGHTLRLVVRATAPLDWSPATPSAPGVMALHGADDGTGFSFQAAPAS